MNDVWSDAHRFALWQSVESAVTAGWARRGVVPRDAAERIARLPPVDAERVRAIEARVRHDVIAFTTAMGELAGADARFIHVGLTSSDVVDTAFALQLTEAVDLLVEELDALLAVVRRRALAGRGVIMIGRTHGIHAEPITLAIKLALWYDTLARARARLVHARAQVAVGKLSGAVGTFAHLDPDMEQEVLHQLGLEPAPISSQIVQRDRHAELMSALALLGTDLDQVAVEIRSLQRTEIGELYEPFATGQKGSSAMPHKRNPVMAEQVSGLARVVRGHVITALENVVLWGERDISHSSAERMIFPDATGICYHLTHLMVHLIDGMEVDESAIARNLERTRGSIYSQRVLLALVEAGASREEAYQHVQAAAFRAAHSPDLTLEQTLRDDAWVRERIDADSLHGLMDPAFFVRHEATLLRRAGIL